MVCWIFWFTRKQAFCPFSYSSQLATCKLRFVFILSDQSRQTTCKQILACKLQADKNTRTDKMPGSHYLLKIVGELRGGGPLSSLNYSIWIKHTKTRLASYIPFM